MSFRDRRAAVCVLQAVFSEGRGRLTAQGPPVHGVEGHRSAFSVSRGKIPTAVLCIGLFWNVGAGGLPLCSLRVIDFTDLTFGLLFFVCVFFGFFFSVRGGEKKRGNLAGRRINQHGHMVAGAAGGPLPAHVFSSWKARHRLARSV